jgi:hypothetical protein
VRIGPTGGTIQKITYFPDGRSVATLNGNGTIYVVQVDR